jgi:hypothetical protein
VLQDLYANKATEEASELLVNEKGSRIAYQPIWKENLKKLNVDDVSQAQTQHTTPS